MTTAEVQTDGHWPFFNPETRRIQCECGQAPQADAKRISSKHVWHMGHRRRLGLQPVEYWWPGQLSGLSRGGYTRVAGHHWENGQWVRS